MKNRNYKEQESGACRRRATQLEAHHRPILERHNHDTLRRVCCSLAVRQDFESGVFQAANRLPSEYCSKISAWRGGKFSVSGERYRRVYATAQDRGGADRGEGGRGRNGRNGREQQADEGGASDSKRTTARTRQRRRGRAGEDGRGQQADDNKGAGGERTFGQGAGWGETRQSWEHNKGNR